MKQLLVDFIVLMVCIRLLTMLVPRPIRKGINFLCSIIGKKIKQTYESKYKTGKPLKKSSNKVKEVKFKDNAS